MNALGEKFRSQIVPGTTVMVPAELAQIFEYRETIVLDRVEQLSVALGDASFRKLENYAFSMFPLPVEKRRIKRRPPEEHRNHRL
jgi:hypothetical protein